MTDIDDANQNENDCYIDIFSLLTNKKNVYLQNYDALEPLQKERDLFTRSTLVGGSATAVLGLLGSGILTPLLSFPSAALTYLSIEYLDRVTRLCKTMEILLNYFGNDKITITPRVKNLEGIIDLLVKLPDKRSFALMLRSNGDSLLKWREDRNNFFISRKKKGKVKTNLWSSLLTDSRKLDDVLMGLKREKSLLLGVSNTERNRPVPKVIVLCGKTKIDPNNDPSLLVDFGRARVLRVQAGLVTYVTERDDLIKFLQKIES